MATLTTFARPEVPNLDSPTVSSAVTITQPDKINSINDFILHQAHSIPDTVLIAYPGSEFGASDFKDFTAKDLDDFADEAAHDLAGQGLKPQVSF